MNRYLSWFSCLLQFDTWKRYLFGFPDGSLQRSSVIRSGATEFSTCFLLPLSLSLYIRSTAIQSNNSLCTAQD